VYFKTESDLFVNLYVSSELKWHRGNNLVNVIQQSQYLEDGLTSLTLKLDKPAEFAINFRTPGWLNGSDIIITVNGKTAETSYVNSWTEIKKKWYDGDLIEVKFDMSLKSQTYAVVEGEKIFSIEKGPLVMAIEKKGNAVNPGNKVSPLMLMNFARDSALKTHYTWLPDTSIVLKPFYEYKENEEYFFYLCR
jgi:DUF1680 family protein